LDDNKLKECCVKFDSTFSHDNSSYFELKVLQFTLTTKSMFAIDILKFVKDTNCYPNVLIVYRVLLTVHVTQ
jgi:hypothetical protein